MSDTLLKMTSHTSDSASLTHFLRRLPHVRSFPQHLPHFFFPFFLPSAPVFYSSQASRQSRKMSVSFIITHSSALGSSFRVSVCVWRVAVGGKGKIRWEGEEEVKKDGGSGQHDSERRKDIDGFVIVEEEKIERRDGVDDEEDKVKGKNTLSSRFFDTFVVRKFTPNIDFVVHRYVVFHCK